MTSTQRGGSRGARRSALQPQPGDQRSDSTIESSRRPNATSCTVVFRLFGVGCLDYFGRLVGWLVGSFVGWFVGSSCSSKSDGQGGSLCARAHLGRDGDSEDERAAGDGVVGVGVAHGQRYVLAVLEVVALGHAGRRRAAAAEQRAQVRQAEARGAHWVVVARLFIFYFFIFLYFQFCVCVCCCRGRGV